VGGEAEGVALLDPATRDLCVQPVGAIDATRASCSARSSSVRDRFASLAVLMMSSIDVSARARSSISSVRVFTGDLLGSDGAATPVGVRQRQGFE
jgi:hypothetical protein